MSDEQIRRALVDHFRLRIGPHMTQYVQRRLLGRELLKIPVMGGDARTGIAVRQIIALDALERAATGMATSSS